MCVLNAFPLGGWNRFPVGNLGITRRLQHSIQTEWVTYVPPVVSLSSFEFSTYNENYYYSVQKNENYCNAMNKNLSFPYNTHASVGLCSAGRRGFCLEFS
jgi:hypothetical protein